MKKIILILVLLISYFAFSQSDKQLTDSVNNIPHWTDIITKVPTNGYLLMKNSFTSEKSGSLGVLIGSTTILLATDKLSYHFINNTYYHNASFHKIADYSVWLGSGVTNLGISGLFSAYGIICNDHIALRTGIQSAESILSTGLVVQLLKRISGRESPASSTAKSGRWRVFPNLKKYQHNQPKYYSFPSGHLSTAVTTLTVIANNYPELNYIPMIGYPLLGLLGTGLVAKNMHWSSDFPLAFAIGYGFGKLITSANSIESNKGILSKVNISFIPEYNNRTAGVSISLSF